MKTYHFWSLFLAMSLLVACTSNSSQQANDANLTKIETLADASESASETQTNLREIAPPIENVLVPSTAMEVEVSEDFLEEMDNGTKIHIPANSLVDANGDPVEGKVDVTYREFHDVADVIMSGIPMHYDSAGETHVLQTAGMVEIRASQDGKPVFIADGKEINVEMASFQDGGYNLYNLNEGTGNWSYIETSTPQPNPRFQVIEEVEELPEVTYTPFKPRKAVEGEPVFPIDADFKRYPELAHFKDLDWQWAGVEEEGCINPVEEQWVFGQIWTKAQLDAKDIDKGLFYLTLSNAQKRAIMLVTPVVPEDGYEKAMASYESAINKMGKVLVARKEAQLARIERQKRMLNAQQLAERQARLVRNFEVQEFGIYNWDKIIKMQEPMQIMASFEFKDSGLEEDELAQIDRVFLVVPDENIVVPYVKGARWGSSWENFIFSPSVKNKIIAVLPDNRIAVFDENDFAKNAIDSEKYTFSMRTLDKKINSPEDLKAVLRAS